MTKTAHTEGRVRFERNCVVAEGRVVARLDWEIRDDVDDANGERLVALWNACEGIANPDVVPEAIEALRQIASHYTNTQLAAKHMAAIASNTLAKLEARS